MLTSAGAATGPGAARLFANPFAQSHGPLIPGVIPWLPIAATGLRRWSSAGALLAGGWVLGDALHLPLPPPSPRAAMKGHWAGWFEPPTRPVSPKLPTSWKGFGTAAVTPAAFQKFEQAGRCRRLNRRGRALAPGEAHPAAGACLAGSGKATDALERWASGGLTPPPGFDAPALLAALRGAALAPEPALGPSPSLHKPRLAVGPTLEQCDLLLSALTHPAGRRLRPGWAACRSASGGPVCWWNAYPYGGHPQDLELELRSHCRAFGRAAAVLAGRGRGTGPSKPAPLQPRAAWRWAASADRHRPARLASLHDAPGKPNLRLCGGKPCGRCCSATQWDRWQRPVLIAPCPAWSVGAGRCQRPDAAGDGPALWTAPGCPGQLRDAAMELGQGRPGPWASPSGGSPRVSEVGRLWMRLGLPPGVVCSARSRRSVAA